MGKPGGFLEFERREPGYRPKTERMRDFRAVEILPRSEDMPTQAARCMACGTPFCHGFGCPLGNIIPEFNDLVLEGRWKNAVEILLSTNCFPEFTGRLCPAPCEAACVLGINDDPVTIRHLELAIIETAFQRGYMIPKPPRERRGKSLAVIGSGPAGLAVADVVNRAGFHVTVFETDDAPGGILRYGIPDFKLEKWVIDRRIDLMKEEGIVFETSVVAGDDVSYRYLSNHFDAICLCAGAREPRDLPIPGRELAGVHFALEFLIRQNRLNAGADPSTLPRISAENKDVVVIGGGDTGSDCVGTALRQGAKSVLQLEIMPKPPPTRAAHTPWPTWPHVLRETSSHREGGERRWLISTVAFEGHRGKLTHLTCMEVDWIAGEDGRPRPITKPGTEFKVDAQLVLLAMGFVGPMKSRILSEIDVERDARNNVKTDSHGMSSLDGVFVAGDVARGQSLIVHAIADGKKAAAGIIRYLSR